MDVNRLPRSPPQSEAGDLFFRRIGIGHRKANFPLISQHERQFVEVGHTEIRQVPGGAFVLAGTALRIDV